MLADMGFTNAQARKALRETVCFDMLRPVNVFAYQDDVRREAMLLEQ